MRVISGIRRGQRLKSFKGNKIRPTADRMKEALFNILGNNLEGKILLDGYSGTGSISIEFLSRSGKSAYLIDNSKESIDIINENLELTKFMNNTNVRKMTIKRFLNSREADNIEFDYIFLDPPYEKEDSLIEVLEIISKRKDNPLIMLETDKEIIIDKNYYDIIDQRKYGRALLTFIKIRR